MGAQRPDHDVRTINEEFMVKQFVLRACSETSRMCRCVKTSTLCVLKGLGLALALMILPIHAWATPTGSVAEVNGETISPEDLDSSIAPRLAQLEEQIYAIKREELDVLIANRLLAQEARKRGVSVAALLDAEVTATVTLVTEAEIEAFYQANKSSFRGDEETARQRIRSDLQNQKLTAQRNHFMDSLRSQATVAIHLQPPPVTRLVVSIEGAPFEGVTDAPVTLVEFSDFHCPFCKRVQTTLKELQGRYPGKIKHVFRNFPIDALHPQARRAAEAARCAQDQGKFWEYHDMLFTRAPQAAPDDLKRYATQVGLNEGEFDHCLSVGVHQAMVQYDLDEGSKLGISGTPAFFINGRPFIGAQSAESFVRMIEEELLRAHTPPTKVEVEKG